MNNKKDPKRNRKKNKNLSGLYVVSHDIAFKDGKPRPEVYGCVDLNSPYITKARSRNSGKPPQYVHDLTGSEVPTVLKNRILAYRADKNNAHKNVGYLVEKSLYEEMRNKRKR